MVVPQTEITATLDGREIFKQVLAPGDYVIGREAVTGIHLDSAKASRRHAQLTLNYCDWTIEDCGSSNGTWVADERIDGTSMLFPGQDLRVGNVHLHLRRLPMKHDDEPLAPQTA